MTANKIWFITGTSRGFGREWAIAALERGDKVAATARDTKSLADLTAKYGDALLALPLDVTDRAAVFDAVARTHDRFGRLDVVVNNAGYGQFGMIEEVSEEQARAQIDTNLFGALWVTQAALPYLRDQGSGHIIQVSSIGGVSAFANVGWYNASKWALEGFSQALAIEVADFGIHVTLVEPTGYATDWAGSSAVHATPLPAYEGVRAKAAGQRAKRVPDPGHPEATREAILKVVDAERPPLRIFFGDGPLAIATADYEQRLETWRAWEPVSVAAHGGNT
ncbi:SDR family oxidoreductase [Nonomuraea sp. M3C6]|uniref:SDR family oxidoreductase n=1 Tax=Nonomuraea marmarensis TaxID=3351344 RepID=A0ABW7AKB9_9ACTN